MDTTQAVSLALVQAVTEFLPVSSSAHLILLPAFMGWKDQGLAFDVAVHFGTLFAVVFHYRSLLREMFLCLCRGDESHDFTLDRRGLAYLAVASIPILPAGYLLAEAIEQQLRTGFLHNFDFLGADLLAEVVGQQLRTPTVIAVATAFFGLLLWASVWYESRLPLSAAKPLSFKSAFAIGLAQVFALIPGVSRAGVTITAGLFSGLTRSQAIKFSFFLAIPAILAASVHEIMQISAPPDPETWRLMTFGFIVSAFAALATLRLFLILVNLIGLGIFVVYRLVLGALLLILFL